MRTIIIIPARLNAVRLPRKPLALIGHQPLVLHVFDRAVAANIGPVVVACCSQEIQQVIEGAGGRAIITDPELPSGTDRIAAAYEQIGEDFDAIINLQGDQPNIEPASIRACAQLLQDSAYDITTLGSPIHTMEKVDNANVVKIALSLKHPEDNHGKGIYFSRAPIPHHSSLYYEHIGIYAYRPESLEPFVRAPATLLEKTERLEQLRALEMGLTIGVSLVENAPISVDTPEDLERAIQMDKRGAQ